MVEAIEDFGGYAHLNTIAQVCVVSVSWGILRVKMHACIFFLVSCLFECMHFFPFFFLFCNV